MSQDGAGRGASLAIGLGLLGAIAGGLWFDRDHRFSSAAFRAIASLAYEQSAIAELRAPSQIPLFRMHLSVFLGIVAVGVIVGAWGGARLRRWIAIFAVGYAIRACLWILGGNLPLVPGDSSHYVEIASSILQGEGPVKHYVESFFKDYPQIREGRGILDDWATPLFAYTLAGAYRLTGVVPGDSLESTFAVAKGLSFVLNLLTLPALYVFAARRFSPRIALASMALLAVLPVHALYAGFELRESLVTLTSLLATWMLLEVWSADGRTRYLWAIGAGLFAGLAILSRNTAMALAAASGLYGLARFGRKQFGPMIVWGAVTCLVIAPWAWATYREYGEPFHTYTKFFPYNFSWAVHHYDTGITRASDFYTRANAPAIARVKFKSSLIIAVVSTMILSVPVTLGYLARFRSKGDPQRGREADGLSAVIVVTFVLATLANVADVTQVEQLGRYYVPLFVIMLPTAVGGCLAWMDRTTAPGARPILALSLVALLWAAPSWAYDYSWFGRSYQLHWPELMKAGEWVRQHPREVPPTARIMTWFPWEFRLASRRTTVLLNRSTYAPHIQRTIRNYGVTHLLWGSFEPPPDVDPEEWSRYLAQVKLQLGLVPSREVYRSEAKGAIGTYPVTLYRLGGDASP